MDLAVTRAVARVGVGARSRSIASKLNLAVRLWELKVEAAPGRPTRQAAGRPGRRGWMPGTISRSTRGAVAPAGAAIRCSP